jgi:putative cell wall-binding protein
MTSSRRTFSRPLLAAVGAGLVALLMLPGAAAAVAKPRTVDMVPTGDATPRGSWHLGASEVDPQTGRVYVLNHADRTIEVMDSSSDQLIPIASIALAETTRSLALDPTSRRLYVSSDASTRISVVDIDPTSAKLNTVVGELRLPTPPLPLSGGATGLTVDSTRGLLLATRTADSNLTTFDLRATTQRSVTLPAVPYTSTFDTLTGNLYVASFSDKSITRVSPDGAVQKVPVGDIGPIASVDGDLLVPLRTAGTWKISRVDPTTWATLSTSGTLAGSPVDIVVDPDLHIAYVSYSGLPVQVMRTDTLNMEGATGIAALELTLDEESNRLVVVDSPLSPTVISHVRSYRPLVSPESAVARLGGADRYEVSAAVSADSFGTDVDVAYVAAGAGFADALSGAPAAGKRRGPVLLVTKESVPDAVGKELQRLKPKSIVVLGGEASVSPAVEAELKGYTTALTRVDGADRYEVSAKLSATTFDQGAPTVFLSSGEVFPDALSASAAAGLRGGPVLLTSKDSLPPAVRAEIERLKPTKIVVAGGPATVSESVIADLRSRWNVERIGGADRYEVSSTVAATAFRPTPTVYIASGATFPDALSGSAAAILEQGPVLLVSKDRIPETVAAQLERLRPNRIIILGGPASVSDTVSTQLKTYLSN